MIDLYKLISSVFLVRFKDNKYLNGSPIDLSISDSDQSKALIFNSDEAYNDFDIFVRFKKSFKPISKEYNDLTDNINNFEFELYHKERYDSIVDSFEMKMGLNKFDAINETKKLLAKVEEYYFHFIEQYLNIPGRPEPIIILKNLSAKTYIESEIKNDNWYLDYVISEYFKSQKKHLELLRQYLIPRINKTNVSAKDLYPPSILNWDANETDLIELVVALLESKSIVVSNRKLKRNELISILSKVFGKEIKNAESLLSRATERYEPRSKFLLKLAESFETYCIKKDQK